MLPFVERIEGKVFLNQWVSIIFISFDVVFFGQHMDQSMIPACECLKDTVARVLPYWYDEIVPAIKVRFKYITWVRWKNKEMGRKKGERGRKKGKGEEKE